MSSFACGLAPNVELLEIFRIVQAVGAAALITNTTAILTDAFPAEVLATGLSTQLTLVAAAQVAGPTLGGFLAQSAGWRAVFWFNVPTGLVGLAWALVTLRKLPSRFVREPFDFAGSLLSLLMLGGLVMALSEGAALGWTDPLVFAGVALFGLATPLFIRRQRRISAPLVDLTLFDSRPRAAAYATNLILAAIRLGVVLLIALYLQAARTGQATRAGLVVSTVAAGIVLTSPVAGWMVRRVQPRTVCTIGLAATAAALILLGLLVQPTTGLLPWPACCSWSASAQGYS